MINNAWGLFSATDHDVTGAAPFSLSTLALTAFFLVPSVLPSLIFCLFSVGLCCRGRPSFPLVGCSLRGGWGQASCWLCRWAAVLEGAPVASPASLAAIKAYLLSLSQMVKKGLQCKRPRLNPSVRKIPWRRKWQPTPVFLPGESRGQRSLVGYSPRGRKELDTTE